MDYNAKKSEQLGMPFGTASGRLRKNLLFSLVKKAGLDVCHQCQGKIQLERELSIEHIVPWLDSESPFDLFFDLDNIAFSHLICNTGQARKTPKTNSKVTSKSGFKGVNYDASKGNYKACVSLDNKTITVGRYKTAEEAARAYDIKALEMYGDRARTNKMLGLLG